MNPEQLESLLLDRELGELSPAVAALLESHLAQDPAAARHAAALNATLALARRAVASPIVPPPRPLDVEQLRQAHRAAQSVARRTELHRLAACLALGLGLGWFARPVTTPAGPGVTDFQPAAFAATTPAEPRSTFWSVTRLTASQRNPSAVGASIRHPLR